MPIWGVVIILLIIAIVLFAWSLFIVDKPSELEEEFDDVTSDLYREIARLNKKIRTLEENQTNGFDKNGNKPNEVEKEVLKSYAKGYTIEKIADSLDIPDKIVKETIQKFIKS